jgi:putative adenylate-forming enzyme
MSSYEQARRRHVQSMLERLDGHMRRLRWSVEQLRQERDARLRKLVSVAKQRSAWHRRRLADVDERTIDEQRLRELPVMRKEEMMEHFDEIVTDPRVTLAAADAHIASLSSDAYFAGELHVVASGGSSGVRGVVVWGWDAWAAVQLALLRQQLTDRLADPELAAQPVVGMVVAANNATHFTSALAQTFATEAVQMHRFPIGLPLDEIVTSLNRVDGDGLATYPSMLATLLSEARAGRLRIRPRRIVTMAEPLPEDVREAAEETWQAPVANMWGISEAGIAALGCFKGAGMHLADDLIIVEPVDADGRPVPAGVASDAVYVTNLLNTVQPIIRYEITDQVTFLEAPCPCGSEHRRIADIQGRRDDTFTYPGGTAVNPHIFRSALAREAGVCEYQVRQTDTGAEILLRAIGPVDEPLLRARLQDALRAQGVHEPLIETRLVDELKRLDTGKLKRFVPRTPPR